jgi:hypothetical protein
MIKPEQKLTLNQIEDQIGYVSNAIFMCRSSIVQEDLILENKLKEELSSLKLLVDHFLNYPD